MITNQERVKKKSLTPWMNPRSHAEGIQLSVSHVCNIKHVHWIRQHLLSKATFWLERKQTNTWEFFPEEEHIRQK